MPEQPNPIRMDTFTVSSLARGPMLDILYEDNHLLAINKPAGLPTMGVAADAPSALALARDYIKQRYDKPGNVYLGVVSRLDAVVSGVLLFARTSKAAARLSQQFADRQTEKTYWAIAAGRLDPPAGRLLDWLVKDEAAQRMTIVPGDARGAQRAELHYRTLRAMGSDTLLEIQLVTGRKHQIRVQLAGQGHAIRGDRKYGSRQPFAQGIALHARRLVIEHPTRREPLELVAPLPVAWRRLGIDG